MIVKIKNKDRQVYGFGCHFQGHRINHSDILVDSCIEAGVFFKSSDKNEIFNLVWREKSKPSVKRYPQSFFFLSLRKKDVWFFLRDKQKAFSAQQI